MRITVGTVDDFVSELEADAKEIHESIVRVRVDRDDIHGTGTLFSVRLWATAVVAKDTGDHLLEFGSQAGHDEPGIGDYTGSEAADEWKERIKHVAETHGLHVRPGKIEVD